MKKKAIVLIAIGIGVLAAAVFYASGLHVVKTQWYVQAGAGFGVSSFRSVTEPKCDLKQRTCILEGPVWNRNDLSWSKGPVTVFNVALVQPDEATFFLR